MRVRVETGSRLHAGFYYAGLEWGIRWGGLGFYVEKPSVIIEAYPCEGVGLRGLGDREVTVRSVLEGLGLSSVCLEAYSLIPAHIGLGSTTQLLLATSMAAFTVKGLSLDPLDVAIRIGRGRVSWVGSLLFKYGGFIVDSGSPTRGKPRPLARHDIPDEWSFVIVTPHVERGLSEGEELKLLEQPWAADLQASYHMSRGALRLSSAVARGDLRDALEGLRELQLGTGLYFSRVQGGVFRGVLAKIVEEASSKGLILAQSSWGPTLYTITLANDTGYVVDVLEGILEKLGLPGSILVSKPRNTGATISKL